MNRVERSTGDESKTTFDGFISYSHAADDLLAPRLQAGLQRFAKPWWKRRAVRIFRDESSLAANPHLWSSITEALDDSSWFVLLLSEDAASSEWVGKEIEHWVEHKSSDRILPVVTDGDFHWVDGDVSGSSVPPALQEVFSEEPRWVDLRFARDETELDLQNPDFSAAVADVASAIRGVPKDELASEEVRQHRRTVRTAWAAGIALAVLAVAAIGFGIQSANNAQEAERQAGIASNEADRANQEADRANQEATRANDEADRANQEADRANANAQLAKARELAASSISVREDDPELATLLAVEAIHQAGDREDALFAEGIISLRQAINANRLVARKAYPGGGRVDVSFTPDGSGLIITSELDRSVSLYSPDDLENDLWTYQDLTTTDVIRKASPHPDGSVVAIIVADAPFVGASGNDDDGLPGRIVILDANTGSLMETVPIGGCVEPTLENFVGTNPSGYSPSGSWFHLTVVGTDCAPDPRFVDTVVFETETWSEVRRLGEAERVQFGEISFTADESLALVNFEFERTELRTYPEFELVNTFDFVKTIDFAAPAVSRISPDGTRLFLTLRQFGDNRPGFWDVEQDSFLGWGDRYSGIARDAVFTEDGLALIIGSDTTGVYDTAKATPITVLHSQGIQAASIATGGRLAATAAGNGTVELWDLGDAVTTPVLPRAEGAEIGWINPNQMIEGERLAIRAFADPQNGVFVVEPATGVVEYERLSSWASDFLPDGRLVVGHDEFRQAPTEEDPGREVGVEGPLMIWDPTDRSEESLQDCQLQGDPPEIAEQVCPDGSPLFTNHVAVSQNGSHIAATSYVGDVRIWDAETLQVVDTIAHQAGETAGVLLYGDDWLLMGPGVKSIFFDNPESVVTLYVVDSRSGETLAEMTGNWEWLIHAVNHSWTRFFVMEDGGQVHEYDTATWEPTRQWRAHESQPRGLAVSPERQEARGQRGGWHRVHLGHRCRRACATRPDPGCVGPHLGHRMDRPGADGGGSRRSGQSGVASARSFHWLSRSDGPRRARAGIHRTGVRHLCDRPLSVPG
jgi:WD40 repeat protein